MQLLPVQLVTIGLGLAWYARREKTVNAPPAKGLRRGTNDVPKESTNETDLELSATQWLARNGNGRHTALNGEGHASSYADAELLAEGELVYLRLDANILTALVPTSRHLVLEPLQLAKGRPDAVPTAPLESASVWLVRRWKQEVVFELHGPRNRRHVLEADPNAPHGVALGGSLAGRKGRWSISPQGLTSARWPEHVLPLQVLPVHLVDARAVTAVKTNLGKKLSDVTAQLDQETRERQRVEARRDELETELRAAKEDAATQVAELRSQVDAAVRSRHAAEREAASLQTQRADEAARTKMALARAAQLEHELQQSEATVRRQQQQIQGMLAGHAEELRTLQQELQIAREANEGLKRAMGEQVMSLQSALELRDARILELEEENDRMDTVLQVIQAQLGDASGGAALIERRGSGGSGLPPLSRQSSGGGADPDAGPRSRGNTNAGEAELSLSEIVHRAPQEIAEGAAEPPLWRSLLELTGDLSLTALKESLAISRRNTAEAAPPPEDPSAAHTQEQPHPPPQPAPGTPRHQAPANISAPTDSPSAATAPEGVQPSPWGRVCSPGRSSSVGSNGAMGGLLGSGRSAGDWGSGGESGGSLLGGDEAGFVSAAARMSGRCASGSGEVGEAAAGPLPLPQLQLRDLSGAAGGVGCGASSAEQLVDAAGAARTDGGRSGVADTPRCDPGATTSRTAAAAAAAQTAVPLSARTSAAGRTPAQLEYGLEATLTLDNLRRRMRQLEAEKDRLELLRASLEESLPWRVAAAVAAGCGGAVLGSPRPTPMGSCNGAAVGPEVVAAAARVTSVGGGAVQGGCGRGVKGEERQLQPHVQGLQGQVQWGGSNGGCGPVAGRTTTWRDTTDGQTGTEAGGLTALQMASTRQQDDDAAAQAQQQGQHDRGVKGESRGGGTSGGGMERHHRDGGEVGTLAAGSVAGLGSPRDCDRALATAAADGTADSPAGSSGSTRVRRMAQELFGGVADGASSPTLTPRGGPSTSSSAAAAASTKAPGSRAAVQANGRHSSRSAAGDGGPAVCAGGAAAALERGCSDGGSERTQAGSRAQSGASSTNSSSGGGGGGSTANCTQSGSAADDLCAEPSMDASPNRDVVCRDGNTTTVDQTKSGSQPTATTVLQAVVFDTAVASSKPTQACPTSQTTAGAAVSAMATVVAPLRLPELIIADGAAMSARADEYGAYGLCDSIDGLCNLGSTRALPTVRGFGGGGNGGALTARRVGHCRQPSSGAVDATVTTPTPAGAAGGGGFSAMAFCSPSQPAGGGCAGFAATTTAEAAAVTPSKSLTSTPGGDDDAAVHCDDQELSPPPGGVMLLGPLEQLRGAAAGALACAAGGHHGGRGGAVRVLSALDEDEEDD